MKRYPAVYELKELGYVPITSAYSSNENALLDAATEQLAAGKKDYRIGLDTIGRRVIMRKADEVKFEED